MRRLSLLARLGATTLAASTAFAQTPSTADTISPEQGEPGLRVAPPQNGPVGAAQGPTALAPQPMPQPPPPPPGATPWSVPPGAAPMVVQPGAAPVVVQQVPYGYGYGYGQPVVYGAPMVMQAPMIPYDGGPVPPGARVVTRSRSGLISGGAAMFGSAWLTSLVVGTTANAARESDGWGWLAVPVIGPLIAGGTIRGVSSSGWTVLILDTLLQSGGLAMFIHGITHPAQFLSYDAPRPTAARTGLRWTLAPGHAAGPGATFAMQF
ncbi:MAG: hypothetical protein U0325_20220 [Polyangiales bacterium]